MLTSDAIRRQFNAYFTERHGHTFVPSSPVVPHDDPTLLFTNAGMNQFKDVFLGTGDRPYSRAVNSQKCIRAGGKHNDLEDVGADTYHHTFFEMLGNWSFGDYFKAEAIRWAWELLTDVWGLPKDRLHATVFEGLAEQGLDPDEEAARLWTELTDIDPAHVHRFGMKDNFWEMGETGPCGPCSEIHIDLTPDGSGGPLVNADDARVIEIWNLVFIQFNRNADRSLSPLPARHVDTGMGFERLCAVLQGKTSNYDTDVFTPLFEAIAGVTGARPYGGVLEDHVDVAYRVIADHIRCLTFALTDGAVPSNDGRGYVLRRILRRAVRHGRQTLGVERPFLHQLVPAVVDRMGEAFPELRPKANEVAAIIEEEEQAFGRTLDRGIALFDQAAATAKDAGQAVIGGEEAFRLHDTFGFPLDLTQVMASERGMTVDVGGFEKRMAEARELARGGGGARDVTPRLNEIVQRQSPPATRFDGYEALEATAKITGVFDLGAEADGDATRVAVTTEATPFYAEAGGQVGDAGRIEAPGGVMRVRDTQRVGEVIFHLGEMASGSIHAGDDARLAVDPVGRLPTMANHTTTHVMNHKLRVVLGDHVQQKGSLVDPEKLRFDFAHGQAVTHDELEAVERRVNEDIAADLPVYAGVADQEAALKIRGLRAVFGEKYPPRVRVVSIGRPVETLLASPEDPEWENLSIEFCGGTHLPRTGDAEGFVIIAEDAVAKGVRRLTALTGSAAHEAHATGEMLKSRLDVLRQGGDDALEEGLASLQQEMQSRVLPVLARAELREGMAALQKRLKSAQREAEKASAGDAVAMAREIADRHAEDAELIVERVDGVDGKALRSAMDVIQKRRPGAALLIGSGGEKAALLASCPKAMVGRGLKAGDWIRHVAPIVVGGGGGRPDMAQAGGKDPSRLDEALAEGRAYAERILASVEA